MKQFMLRSLMLLSLLCSTWGVGSVWAQFRDGGIYNLKNASATGQSMTITEYSYLIVATTNLEDEMQLWEADEVSTGVFTLRNLSNGKYLKSPNSSYNAYWTTVATVDDNCKFSCTAVGDGTYTMRATNSTNNYHYLYYGSGKIQCWTADVKASRWYITEKVTYNDADVPGALSNLFSDAACTQLKKSFANEAAIEEDADYKKLPTELRNMVKKVYSNTWTENNYDGSKSAWDSDYAKKYRVQWYEPYNEKMSAATALGINWHTNMNNPTGIFANNGDKLYVMVEGTIKEGATLYIESYTGHGKLVDNYKNGQQLQPGLNIISCTADGSNYCINYIVETFDTSDGKRGNQAKKHRLSEYDDLKIHIEGGYINGYYNKMGDDLYTPDKNADWDYIAARATQTDVTILGEYIVLQFPLNDVDTEGNKGLNYYLTGKNIIEAVIDEWDKVMIWERLLLGVLDKETTEAEAKQSPYSVTLSKNVFEYTGDDEGDFESGYGDYYNVHGLSFGVGGSAYMYGSGDHCGYHYNTMESIIQNILTNAGSHWGPGHEIGHQHQALLTVNGLTEVTNNLFSNVVLWYFGETTSRYNGSEGSLSNVLAQFNTEGADFFSNNIWGQTIMYYKLFLYYHVLGHNPKFYPRLFEMLRQDPMSTGYEQDGSKCLMHFYKKCCLAAGEDLTEFFRAHGFFEVMDNRLVGDYSNSVYNLTQAQIDAAIKEVKNLGYEENIAVLFITDATGETIKSHKGDDLELYGETQVCAELGSYANFNNNTASTYTATVSGTTVTMSGDGGVGFAILNKKGELIGFSDKKTFELSLDAVEAILNGEANFVVVNGDASTTPATIEGNADERNKSLLGEMMEQMRNIISFEDATGKKIGYYKSSSLASMKETLEKAQTVYDNEEKTKYTAVFNALKQEYNAFLAADYNEIPMTAGTFILKNCSNNQHLYVNEEKLALTNTAEANLENTAKWVFEKTGAGKYYIKNLATEKYIGALAKDDNVPVLNATGADAYDVVPMGNPGEFAIAYGDKLSFNTSWKGVIGWDYDGDRNSWWYITAVETDPADAQAVLLKELLENTQALYDQMAVTPIPEVIPLTESSYFSNALQSGGAYPSDNFTSYSVLCDGDPFTHFHSAYSGTNPGTHHYIRVDLGEEYKSDLFAFTYTNRASNNLQNPTAITVEGCNEVDGTYEHIVSLTTLDGLPTAEASSFESELLGTQGDTYRYLRFKVTATNSNAKFGDYPYFSITELGVLKGSFAITANSKYASNTITDAYMLEVFNALRQAKHDYRNATTADDYKRAYDALNTHYTTLLNAYNEVKDADLTAKQEELLALINKTTTLIGQCGSVNYIPGTFDGEAPLQTTNVNSGFYLSTNAPEPEDGAIGNLLDADMNSFFHSAWSVDIEAEHYLLVDVGEGNELKDFTFSYQSNKRPIPATIKVYGSNNNSDYTLLATFSKTDETNPIPTTTSTKWTSSRIVKDVAYRYLRFNVTESTGNSNISPNPKGEYCFVMSDFDITAYGEEASYEVTVKVGDVTEDLLLATYKENQEANSTLTYATTEAQLDKAIADLQAQYDALEAAKGVVDKQPLIDLIATATTLMDACGRVADNGDVTLYDPQQAGSVNKNMIRELYRAIEDAQEVIDNTNATQEEVNTEITELTAKMDIVQEAQQDETKAKQNLKAAIDLAQTAINACATSITQENGDYTVVWKSETAGDVDKATLIAAYEALVQANEVYYGNASTVSQYQEAKEDLSTPIATLNQYQQGYHKAQLKSMVDLLTALIEKCNTEGQGDLTTGMLEEMVQLNETATEYLTQEFATQEVLVSTIDGAISDIETNYPTWSDAQQSTAKAELLDVIDQLERLIEQCRTNGTKTITTDVPCALQTSDGEDFYISTNATATEGDIANLVDGKMNTSFQTKNSVDAEHYLLVDAGDGKALKKFKFSYRTNKSFFPYTIVVYGSNDKEATFTELATFTDLPTNADQLWTSSEIGNGTTAYRYLRFNITKSGIAIKVDDNKDIDTSKGEQLSNKYKNTLYTETPQVEYCFAMSEFDLINRVDVEGVTEDQITPAETAIDDANALAETSADATALSDKKSDLERLYNDLKAAYDAASQRIQVTLTTTDAKRDELLSGIEFGQTIGTFSAPYATVIPEGVTAYYAVQNYEGGTVSLTPIEKGMALPAEQGVILIGEVGVNSVMFIPAAGETEADLNANTFSHSATSSVYMEDYDYILANGGQGIGFYHATPGSTLKQGKAFFRILDSNTPLSFVLRFGGNTTDIDAVTTGTPSDDELIYDIYGRRVTEVKKGNIYIKNGKKFFVK